jgi:hypothetical protein
MHTPRIVAGVVVAVLSAASLVAQSAAQGGAQRNTGAAAERVTLTGCIERADQLTSAPGTLGTTVGSLDFVLIKAEPSGAANTRSQTPAATGTAGTAVGSMYRLDAEVAKLNPHVGHKVEIVGMREGTSVDAAAAQAANALNPNAANAPRLRVESVKMISESCPR